MIKMPSARFSVGDVVQHKLFDYRGVIVDVDTNFQGTEEWYEVVARSRPPKHRPWYHTVRWSYFVGQSEGDLKVDSDGLQSPRGPA